MKYVDEFRSRRDCEHAAREISRIAGDREITLMEVCGTHTMALFRYGIRDMLPPGIQLLSGPGCPVCVTPNGSIDRAIALARREEVIIATFGDMTKVPGSSSSLSAERSRGADIRIVYSPLHSLKLAEDNPEKMVVFLGIGFETTAPLVAATIQEAALRTIGNFTVLCSHRLIPPAISFLLKSGKVSIDGFLLPGHVSAIIGTEPYEFIPLQFGKACVVAGFEPFDIFQSILMLVKQVSDGKQMVENQYKRAVRSEGNEHAIQVMEEVFEPCDGEWRGLGVIPESSLRIGDRYADYDAMKIAVFVEPSKAYPGCICGAILRGEKEPSDCVLFGTTCTPEEPKGPCMVSSEGTCAAHYKYHR
jgi:hydrogenase expression/formation protein HypD